MCLMFMKIIYLDSIHEKHFRLVHCIIGPPARVSESNKGVGVNSGLVGGIQSMAPTSGEL